MNTMATKYDALMLDDSISSSLKAAVAAVDDGSASEKMVELVDAYLEVYWMYNDHIDAEWRPVARAKTAIMRQIQVEKR
jgi:hypothetical protein